MLHAPCSHLISTWPVALPAGELQVLCNSRFPHAGGLAVAGESVGPTPHSKPYPEWPWLQLNPNTISLCPSLPPIQVSPILKTGGSSDDRTVKLVIHVLRVSIRACVTDRVGVAGPERLAACFKQKFKAWQARRMRPVYVPTLRCALPPPDAAQHYCIGAVVCNPDV